MRAIHIFPESDELEAVDAVRIKYDPLAELLRPHITLVFPFESQISTEALRRHIQGVSDTMKSFPIVLAGITGEGQQFLFLNVKVGNDQLIELHDKLYTGILQQHLNRSVTYVPHVTVGRLPNKEAWRSALDETKGYNLRFVSQVHEIVVEDIGESGESTRELAIPLSL